MEALHDVVKAGKVRYLGASSMYAWQFAKLQHAADRGGWTPFVSMQNQYNLLRRQDEPELMAMCADMGVGLVPYSPQGKGRLARPWGEQSLRSTVDKVVQSFDSPLDEPVVDAVQQVAEARGVTMAQVALAWVLANPGVSAPIVGATKAHHLPDAVAALDLHAHRRRDPGARSALHPTRALLVLTGGPPREALSMRGLAGPPRLGRATLRLPPQDDFGFKEIFVRGAVMYAPGDVRVEERGEPRIVEPTDAILRMSATCICGSDLWPYRGIDALDGPTPMGHEYAGIVEEVGSEVTTIKPGQFVIGSFFASDNTCEICRAGYQSSCVHRVGMGTEGAQAELFASRSPTARWSPPRTSRPTTWSRACSPPPTCSAPAGSAPWPPRPARARRSPSSVTARSGCSACWPPSSSARSGSSR